MTNEWSGIMIIDEIDRLSVAYNKAKEYLTKITSGIEQQIEIWQYRQQIIRDQLNQTKPSSSYDFLLPKTQRINELTLEAVEGLCRVDLLIEQILRIDLKSRMIPTSTSFSTRSSDTNITSTSSVMKQQPILNGQQTMPVPVLRTQQQISSGRLSTLPTQEKTSFKPVIIQQQPPPNISENIVRPSSIHPQNNSHYSGTEGHPFSRPFYGTRTPQLDQSTSPFGASSTNQTVTNYQPRQQQQQQQPRKKEKIKLQRIPPGTKWKQAKIDIIDSLSGFYVGNLDPKVHDKFLRMQEELHDYYNDLEKTNQLMPLENVAIGDFGVAKYSEDNQWYRARLIMCEEHDQIKIVFVDFGNIEIKSINDFFPIYKLFTDLPAQAIACSLSQAFPCSENENGPIWSDETIEVFKDEVIDKIVEVQFSNQEEGTEQWPLHFVNIIVGNQSVTNLLSLQKRIDPRPNRFIAEQLAPSLSQQEYILFNVPISEDDF
jgi:hypothetical protein